ncbi:uncharacterized protein EV420DRAFT_843689 [Desarmillaria tabescens]|uniref:F-box domain-containing protein n=1 Tax=Armillaria tabescens TaxID=1929756 RepID=A0AA39JVY2_ARMTA|nr:uncharacterized protein EV420DRAFT_843689 [Desarmillaria tabescens]KAK0448449.1 hypothetical protein EV420DRAFT_843689 [Desarmillaria tabescens]
MATVPIVRSERQSQIDNFTSSQISFHPLTRIMALDTASCFAQRVPNELLSYIFLSAFHQANAIHLSHVCSRWRNVALSTGSLWTDITITFPTSVGQLSCALTCLRRSKVYPLDLYLDFRDPAWDWDEHSHGFGSEDMETVLGLLLPHANRWKSVNLLTDTWAPMWTFLKETQRVEMPTLRSVKLSRCNAYFVGKGETFEPAGLREPLRLFGGQEMGTLREVGLVGVHVDWAGSGLRNLLDLELKYHASDVMPTFQEFKAIMEGCPDLKYLSIVGWGPRFDSPPILDSSATLIRLPNLIRFSFGFVDTEYAIRLLEHMVLPVLMELALEDVSRSLSFYDAESLPDVKALLEWFTGDHDAIPCSRLLTLELHGIRCCDSDTLRRFFCKFLMVGRISLSDADVVLLEALKPGTLTPCPALTEISCRRVDFSKLSELVGARASSSDVSSFKNVHVDLFGDEFVGEQESLTIQRANADLSVSTIAASD